MPEKSSSVLPAPPDQHQRIAALDSGRSVIVQAPAGSGKTDLLTRRFLRLLAEVDDPKQVVAITFTRAAAAEMRHRILEELEKASARTGDTPADEFSMEALAARALSRSRDLDWRLPDLASQLRISTIDSFCRELAIQQPIFSGIGNRLQINERPSELYRAAARATMQKLGDPGRGELSNAIKDLLLWRDNGWKELEELLVKMLGQRDRWMHGFVLSKEKNWDLVRQQLERPLANVVRAELQNLELLMDRVPGASEEAHELSQFACEHGAPDIHRDLAERADFPHGPHQDNAALEDARSAYLCLADLLLTNDGKFRARIDSRLGFPKEHRDKKIRLEDLIDQLSEVAGLEEALAGIRIHPPARYTGEDWQIIRASFILLRHAAGELKTIFAETGAVDFIEVAQIARKVLSGEDQLPSDAALAVADDIHHLLVDEFQDTSRRQHEFVTSLIEAWPDSAGRTIFVVGDPMQSIYFFRDAEAALFRRVKDRGFELSDGSAYPLSLARLTSNFRTAPELVVRLNGAFAAVFAEDDGSGIEFAEAEAARAPVGDPEKRFELHLTFMMPQARAGNSSHPDAIRARQQIVEEREAAGAASTRDVVALIASRLDGVEAARVAGQKYRIAVLGRARAALAPIAEALRHAGIPFRAVELETLKDQPEILDAVALTRALFNPQDRVAWLGVLRAPWCGLSLAEIHAIAGADGESHSVAPVPQLLSDRIGQLSETSRQAAERVIKAFAAVPRMRAAFSATSVGTLIQQLWRALGGDRCADDTARANLDLFWKLLDKMPGGEQDLLGPALDAALEDLCALPDPATSSDHGVQLMTIHKSKGLEFEIVIVPELQAVTGGNKTELLSWMERGLVDPDEGELTEFLIAPVQSKGDDPGKAKRWIDRLRNKAEAQEMRRILYVAATRARDELHLFARPNYKRERDGSLTLPEPAKCLLATAWPALGEETRARFEEWKSALRTGESEIEVTSIAAAGEDNLVTLPHPTILRRLPPGFEPESVIDLNPNSADTVSGLGDGNPYQRHEGGLQSRALGNAVHTLLEELARLRRTHEWPETRAALEKSRPRILALVRSTGLAPAQAEKIAADAFQFALTATRDPQGQWILSPHADAASESEWAGVVGGTLRQVRVDRLFRAGVAPLQPGADALWVIDYKTAHVDNLDAASSLPVLRAAFAPQLNMYAAVLRNLHGAEAPIRAGLYYPRMSLFDWWAL